MVGWNTYCRPMDRNVSKVTIDYGDKSEFCILVDLKQKCEDFTETYKYDERFLRELYYNFSRYLDKNDGIIWNPDHETYDDLIDFQREALYKIPKIIQELKKYLLNNVKYWANCFQYIYELWIDLCNYILIVVL